jgi:hypothetical protein
MEGSEVEETSDIAGDIDGFISIGSTSMLTVVVNYTKITTGGG